MLLTNKIQLFIKKYIFFSQKTKGYSFIELLVSLGLFSILSFSVLYIINFSATANEKITIKQEIFENARLCLDFIETQVRICNGVKLTTNSDDTLKYLELYNGAVLNNSFKFNNTTSISNVHYHRLEFGGETDGVVWANELGKYVTVKMWLYKQNDILKVMIISDTKTNQNSKTTVSPIILERNIYLKYKTYK